ncbi:hypothetical protein B0H11DRAFT_1037327 [Mycena galericulata]|nr:hypothetical protein B0H11DRAFT_1037327 [Mycena galericulata]
MRGSSHRMVFRESVDSWSSQEDRLRLYNPYPALQPGLRPDVHLDRTRPGARHPRPEQELCESGGGDFREGVPRHDCKADVSRVGEPHLRSYRAGGRFRAGRDARSRGARCDARVPVGIRPVHGVGCAQPRLGCAWCEVWGSRGVDQGGDCAAVLVIKPSLSNTRVGTMY